MTPIFDSETERRLGVGFIDQIARRMDSEGVALALGDVGATAEKRRSEPRELTIPSQVGFRAWRTPEGIRFALEAPSRSFTREEIAAMDDAEYAANRLAIVEALRHGKIGDGAAHAKEGGGDDSGQA